MILLGTQRVDESGIKRKRDLHRSRSLPRNAVGVGGSLCTALRTIQPPLRVQTAHNYCILLHTSMTCPAVNNVMPGVFS